MIWRWVLGILTLLILLLCRTRAGVLVTLKDTVRVDVKLGWLRFQIVPGKKEAPKTKKPKGPKREEKRNHFQSPLWRIYRMCSKHWDRR